MKIGFLGNTNNYPLALAMALKEKGEDVRFIVDQVLPLHRPEYRYRSKVAHGGWIVDLAPMRTWDVVFSTSKRRRALAILGECDAIVVNGIGIGLASLLDKPTFVISTGADLDTLANPRFLDAMNADPQTTWLGRIRNRLKMILYRRLIPMQRRGFEQAIGVEYAYPSMLPHGDALLQGIGVPDSRRHCFFLTDLNRLSFTPPPSNEKVTLLVVARLNWVHPLPPGFDALDNKRVDIFLEGVAEFRRRGGAGIQVKLVRKGLHIKETEALVERLSLTDCVSWLDEMNQATLTQTMLESDIIVDHFGDGSIGVSVRDALALGRPVIANGKSEVFETHVGEPLPIAQAQTPGEVADAIERLLDPANRVALAVSGRSFAERHFSAANAATIIMSVFEGVTGK